MVDAWDSFEDLSQNIWEKYGFKGNPFDTRALAALPDDRLPVAKAIVGRKRSNSEARLLTNFLKIPGGGRVVVEGEIGVGKTTFVNYHRFLWEYKARDKLFSTTYEISVIPTWSVKDFLLNILGALITKLQQSYPDVVSDSPLLQETLVLSKVFFSNSFQVQGSFLGIGGGFGKGMEVSMPSPSEVILVYYLEGIVKEVKKLGYCGIILHFDDMELISRRYPQAITNLLEDIRNILQLPDIYYIFIGHPGFFSGIISPLERVRSIFFGYPIHLPPLSKGEVVEAIERRYHLLSAGSFRRPVENTFIEKLYDLYNGKIRFIMDAMTLVIPDSPNSDTLSSEDAYDILKRLVCEKLQHVLTARELWFLKIVASQNTFTNKDASNSLGLSVSQVSQSLSRLQELNFVLLQRQVGRNRYYQVSEDVKIIKDIEEIGQGKAKNKSLQTKQSSRKCLERLSMAEQILKKTGRMTCKEYQQKAHISSPTARRDLAILVTKGKALRIGKGRNVCYILAKGLSKNNFTF